MNVVEREPVETRVINPTASERSYKPKQRSCRTTNLQKKVPAPNSPGAEMSGAEMSSAESAAPSRRGRNIPDPPTYVYIFIYKYVRYIFIYIIFMHVLLSCVYYFHAYFIVMNSDRDSFLCIYCLQCTYILRFYIQ